MSRNQPTKTKVTTIRDVAALAGVSVMTVSRVLRREKQVAETTRNVVLQAVEQLGYVPSVSARNLSSAIPKVIGLVIPNLKGPFAGQGGYEYLALLHLGALKACDELEYGLMLLEIGDQADTEKLIQRTKARQVGGYLVAAPATEIDGLLPTLREKLVPYVALNPLLEDPHTLVVASKDHSAVKELVLKLIRAGHRKIGFVGANKPSRAYETRLMGYRDALLEGGLSPDHDSWVFDAPPSTPGSNGHDFLYGLEVGRKILAKGDSPTAIQCITDDTAAGVLAAAHEAGLILPQELSVTGFDDFGLANKVWPPLTTAALPISEMARDGARMIIEALEGEAVRDHRFYACHAVERESIARRAIPRTADKARKQ